MRNYVVLQELKAVPGAAAAPPYLVVVGVEKAHDREAAITAVYKRQADGDAKAKGTYRAIPITAFDPAVDVGLEAKPTLKLTRSGKRTLPPKTPATPAAAGKPAESNGQGELPGDSAGMEPTPQADAVHDAAAKEQAEKNVGAPA